MLVECGELVGYRVREFPGRDGKPGYTKRYLGIVNVQRDDYGRMVEETTDIEVTQSGVEAAQRIASKYVGKKVRVPVYVSVYVAKSGKAGYNIVFSHLSADEIEVID